MAGLQMMMIHDMMGRRLALLAVVGLAGARPGAAHACCLAEAAPDRVWRASCDGEPGCECWGRNATQTLERDGLRWQCGCSEPQPRLCSEARQRGFTRAEWFACADGAAVPLSAVDDDYCDCADGSDEPSTAACAGREWGEFLCINAGHHAELIPSSRVGDGVCDCCDGSDEATGQCNSTCAGLAEEARRRREELRRLHEQGAERRAEAERAGLTLRERWAKQSEALGVLAEGIDTELLAPLERLIRAGEDERRAHNREQLLAWARMRSRRFRLQSGAAATEHQQAAPGVEAAPEKVQLAKTDLEDLEAIQGALAALGQSSISLDERGHTANPKRVVPLRRFLEIKAEEVERKRQKRPLAARSIEERRKATLLAPLLAKGSGAWFEVASLTAEALGVVASPARLVYELSRLAWRKAAQALGLPALPGVSAAVGLMPALRQLQTWASQTGARALWFRFWDAGPTLYYYMMRSDEFEPLGEEPGLVKVMRWLAGDLRLEIKRVRAAEESTNKLVNTGVGGDAAFLTLAGQCFVRQIGEYRWQLCPFDSAKQGRTSVGNWVRWEVPPGEASAPVMLYEGGLKCWNGPNRNLRVRLECGLENKILSVDEPSACTYEMVFATPLVCSPAAAEL